MYVKALKSIIELSTFFFFFCSTQIIVIKNQLYRFETVSH